MMKVARTPITFQYLREMNSLRFKKRSPHDLKPLLEMGFITFDGERYAITEAGVSAVYAIASQQTRPSPAD